MHNVQPKHKINFEEFIRAVKGEPFNQTEWFYTAIGNDIELGLMDTAVLAPEQQYIVCRDAELLTVEGYRNLYLIDVGHVNRPAFVFYQCFLPNVILENSKIDTWLFYESVAGFMDIGEGSMGGDVSVESSKLGDISVRGKSECGYVWVGLNSEVGSIGFSSESKGEEIEVLEGSICGSISLHSSKVGEISINNSCQVANISIENHSSAAEIYVNRSKIEYISIIGSSDCGNILVTYNSIAGDILLAEESKADYISIKEHSLCNFISIVSNSQSKSLQIEEGSLTSDIRIMDSRVGQITVTKNYFSIYFFNAVVPFIRLVNCCIHQLAWSAGMRSELYMDGGKVNYLKLYKTAVLKDAVFSLNNVHVFIVQLQELLVHGQLVFRNITSIPGPFAWEPDTQQIIHVEKSEYRSALPAPIVNAKHELINVHSENYKKRLSDLNATFNGREAPLFCIVDSSLGKTEITGCDLEKFHFEYRDSKLLETFFSGTRLPRENIKIYKEDPESKLPLMKYYGQKVSIYNQLKKIFDNQGDLVESTWYHAKAMEYQERLVKEDFKQDGKLFSEQWFDLKRFWLNKITNNHGESWRLALRFILFISVGTYSLYYLSLHFKEPFSFAGTDRFFSNYILFLDPTHKIDFHVTKETLWFLPVLLDFAGRLLIAYGIYQFIAAFRKHSRRAG